MNRAALLSNRRGAPPLPSDYACTMIIESLPPSQQRQLTAFSEAVQQSPHNLLSKRALEELESRHIAESVAFGRELPADASVLDLGTGGGFPGMVVAITRPDLAVTLLDATKKKVDFLREFADAHSVRVTTLHGRAEELQREHAGRFDVVTARAVAPLDRLVGWAVPFLRPGGHLYAIKGAKWRGELQEALPMLRRIGATVADVPRPNSPVEQDETSVARPRVVIIRAAG